MTCPKCGAQVEEKLTACPYCKAELEASNAEAAAPAEEKAEAAAAEKKACALKEKLSKINFKEPKTMLMCGALILALFIAIAAICGIVAGIRSATGPENTAEAYIEAMADGNMKKLLRKSAPWIVRSAALGLDLKENASIGKIAKEYEDLGGIEKAGKIKITKSEITAYANVEKSGSYSSSIFGADSAPTYKELRNITEVAKVKVYGTLKNLDGSEDFELSVTCARLGGKWVVIEFNGGF